LFLYVWAAFLFADKADNWGETETFGLGLDTKLFKFPKKKVRKLSRSLAKQSSFCIRTDKSLNRLSPARR